VTKPLTYADALKILGHRRSRLVALLDGAASAGLVAWAAAAWSTGNGTDAGIPLNLFELKNDIVRFGQVLADRAADWRSGLSRFDRTQRLAAAHAVLVVSAYFEALESADLPVPLEQLALTPAEKVAQATGERLPVGYVELIGVLTMDRLPLPECHRPYTKTRQEVGQVHARLAERVASFTQGLSLWDELNTGERRRMQAAVTGAATLKSALRRYDESYRRLATDNHEFAVWASLSQAHALGAELSAVIDLLASATARRPGNRAYAGLLEIYRSALDEPVISSAQAPEGVVVPTLGDAYVNPSCRVAEVVPGDAPAEHDWWLDQDSIPDVERLLAGYLVSPRATQAPLVVLGEPGSGKSKLTEALAARLAGSDFLPLRVELRAVPAESMIHEQIEHAVYRGPGERVGWPELLEAAAGALPVVMLDGFDELLQASGVNRYDYLEQVRDFQRTQARLGYPVAVIVTSRTVVADRVRFPIGTLAVRLEPFDEARVRRWLAVWARHNSDVLAARDLRPLPAETALSHPELAGQPLLLMLLALFDATDNALQRDGAGLGPAELYEALLTDFALREVRRAPQNQGLSTERQQALAERELHRLAVVALAMFSRRRQSVTAAELDRDLPILFSEEEERERDPGERPADVPTAAQHAIGRFFFLHTSEASRGGQPTHSYEFLHATFGEFLTAWLTVRALRDLAAVHQVLRRGVTSTGEHLVDGFLYAALSFSCLAERRPTVDFLTELLHRVPDRERTEIRRLIPLLLSDALYPSHNRAYRDYEPVRLSIPRRLAAYTANLTLLLVLLADEPVDTAEPFEREPVGDWLRHTGLWHGQFAKAEWDGLIDVVRARVVRTDQQLRVLLVREDGSPVAVRDVIALLPPTSSHLRTEYDVLISDPDNAAYDLAVPPGVSSGHMIREMAYLPNWRTGLLLLHSIPALRTTADALRWRNEDEWRTLPGLRIAELDYERDAAPERRMQLYRDAFGTMIGHPQVREQLLLRLADEVHRLPPALVLDLLRLPSPGHPTPAHLVAVDALWRRLNQRDAKRDPQAKDLVVALVRSLQRTAPGIHLVGLSPDLLSAAHGRDLRAA